MIVYKKKKKKRRLNDWFSQNNYKQTCKKNVTLDDKQNLLDLKWQQIMRYNCMWYEVNSLILDATYK